MTRLSTTVNPHQSGTLPSNTIKNLMNDGHSMDVTIREGKQAIDPPMSSVLEGDMRMKDDITEASGEFCEATIRESKLPQKVVHTPRLKPPFPQRLVKKIEDVKYRWFITVSKHFSINVLLIKVFEQMPGYAKFIKDI